MAHDDYDNFSTSSNSNPRWEREQKEKESRIQALREKESRAKVTPEIWGSVRTVTVNFCQKNLAYAEDAGIDAGYTKALRLLIERIKELEF